MTNPANNEKAGAASTAADPLDTEVVHPVSSDTLKVDSSPEKSSQGDEPYNGAHCEHNSKADEKCPPTMSTQNAQVLPKSPSRTKAKGQHSNWKELVESGQFGSIQWDDFIQANTIKRNGNRVILDEVEVTRLQYECEAAGCPRLVFKQLEQFLKLVARQNPFDSAQEMLFNLPPWDGIKRVETFLPTYLDTYAGAYEEAVGRYWLTACAARIVDRGCKADMMPVLVGGNRDYKSTCLQNFVPAPGFWVEACLTDSARQLTQKVIGKLLVIWEDLAGIKSKSDADKVKTFISSPVIALSSRYHPGMDQQPRQFTLAGTSSRKDFLRDPATYGRYLPFEIGKIDIKGMKRDMPQIWAEAFSMVRERQGGNLPLVDYEDAEMLARYEYHRFIFNKYNTPNTQHNWDSNAPLIQMLRRGHDKFTTADALVAVGLIGENGKPYRDKMSAQLKKIGFRYMQIRVEGRRQKVWRNPVSLRPKKHQ